MVDFVLITGPEHWASYLVNGDASGMTDAERARADAWLQREGVRVIDIASDENGEALPSRFTWRLDLYAPECGCRGGSVVDYVALKLKIGSC